MKVRGTDFVMLPVSKLATAAQFYRDTLGLPQEVYSEEHQWAEFDCGNVTLALKGGATPGDGGTGVRLALAVDDVGAAYDELKAAGARLAGPPQDHGVCRHLEVVDPDGHVVILHRRTDGSFGR
jgi:catechol 2,3-dioxygenase-like lactoylglutathione lyase family enzyme